MLTFYTNDSSDVNGPLDFGASDISEIFITGTNFCTQCIEQAK